MSSVPENLQYTSEHEWVAASVNTNTFRIGITDFAQSALGDIVYIQLPKLGSAVTAGSVIVTTLKTIGGTVGATQTIKTITPQTGFTIVGLASDTSVYNYLILG